MENRVPVTLLTGFLGAGKSTLLERILQEEHGMRVCVIQNEKNNLGLERIAVAQNSESFVPKEGEDSSSSSSSSWIDLPNGCACCTVKDDLVVALEQTIARGRFEHVVVELSGLADPSQLVQIFWTDEALECPFVLDAVVCVTDARHVADHLRTTHEAPNQIAFADVVLVNKIDLLPSHTVLAGVVRQICALNPQAKVLTSVRAETDLRLLLNIHAFDPKRSMETFVIRTGEGEDGKKKEHVHTSSIVSELLSFDCPLQKKALETFLADLLWEPGQGHDVLRMKGLLSFHGEANKYALQAVRETWQLEETKSVANDGLSQFVLIGRNMQIDAWREKIKETCM